MTLVPALGLSREGRAVLAKLSGELDLATRAEVQHRLFAWISNDDDGVILDLTALAYIDSAGLAMVFDLAARLRRHGQAMHVVVPPGAQPWKTFQVVGAGSTMGLHGSVTEAVAALGAGAEA